MADKSFEIQIHINEPESVGKTMLAVNIMHLYNIFREHFIHVFSFSLTLCPGGNKSLYILFVQLLRSVGAAGN